MSKYDILTCEDIELIGDLFNTCMDRLEAKRPEYRDWGVPDKVLAKEVLEEFKRIKSNE